MAEQLEFGCMVARNRPQDATYTVYTDGACLRNPGGPGAWCAIVLCDGVQIDMRRANDKSTTNNRMELMAAIYGMLVVPVGAKCTVMTDSKYVQLGAMYWRKSWERKKFRGVKNLDLWQRLLALKDERKCVFKWVRGHNGDKWNEKCDELAGECARSVLTYEDQMQA